MPDRPQPDRPEPDLPDELEIPDDLSGLTEPTHDPELAVLITQIAGARPLAAACALAQIDADAVATPVGALAVLRDRTGDAPDRAASAISQLVRGVPLVLATRRGEQLTCVRYQDGQSEGTLAPGLVLGGAPETLEDLLTGEIAAGDLPDVVPSSSIGRLKAMRMLTGAARKARKKG